MNILTYNPRAYIGSGPSYCCASISGGLDRQGVNHRTTFLRAQVAPPCRVTAPLATRFANHARFHLDRDGLKARVEDRFLREIVAATDTSPAPTVAILWTSASIGLIERLKAAGAVVVFQMINTCRETAKAILDAEYETLGIPNPNPLSDADSVAEQACLAAVDYIFAPSQPVVDSLIRAGIGTDKILHGPFGWDPGRFSVRPRRKTGFQALFVGSVCVRKGSHVLLKAWAESGIEGELVLCGNVEPAIRQTCGDLLARPDVRRVEFTRRNSRIAQIYQAADVFVFPTLEEGAPLVTYEAAGAGLPIITTAMGACGLVRNGVNGFLLEAHDLPGWIDALRRVAASSELRRRLGGASREIAASATWDHAAERRCEQLDAVLRHHRTTESFERNSADTLAGENGEDPPPVAGPVVR